MTHSQVDRFWQSAAKVEQAFFSDYDAARFKRRMRRLGFPAEVITERLAAVEDNRYNTYLRPSLTVPG